MFPHLLRRFVALAVVVVGVVGSLAVAPAGADVTVQLTRAERHHLDALNEHRRARGLPPAVADAHAQADARAWAAHLAAIGRLAHAPDLHARCLAASTSCDRSAENVGYASTSDGVLAAFASSSGHHRNMGMTASADGRAVRVGVGVIERGGRTWVVQRFYRCHCDDDELARWMNLAWASHLAVADTLGRDLLGRRAGDAELDRWAAPMLYGADTTAVAWDLANSPEWVGASVDELYRMALDRAPDASGRHHWTELIRRGASTAEVAVHLLSSPEYFERVGGTDRAWLADLYQEVLGRNATRAELDDWVGARRAGHTRSAVAGTVFQSLESRRVRVGHLYEDLLGRSPDPDGSNYWARQLADGHDVRLAVFLAGSDEYRSRALTRSG